MVLHDGELSQLYLDPDWRGRGLGDRFVALAKEGGPGGLDLWTFLVNKPAHRFYERHGFVAVEHTDGSGNEEREPDLRYVWRPLRQVLWLFPLRASSPPAPDARPPPPPSGPPSASPA